ncbi:MAG: M23 family metallopeptidase [Chloroflexota bacterium]
MKKLSSFIRSPYFLIGGAIIIIAVFVLLIYGQARVRSMATRFGRIGTWFDNPTANVSWQITGGERCGDAPMLMPTTGFIGVRWNDGMPPLYQHSGLDIFSPDGADNVTPIYAAYDGYLYRQESWRSAVIIRHPNFEHLPDVVGGQQIWTYYTHMASADGTESFVAPEFPRGTSEVFVEAGTLLGYQGSWSGSPTRQMGRHLHISIVKSDSDGTFLNETDINNTLNPAPFLGLTTDENDILKCN